MVSRDFPRGLLDHRFVFPISKWKIRNEIANHSSVKCRASNIRPCKLKFRFSALSLSSSAKQINLNLTQPFILNCNIVWHQNVSQNGFSSDFCFQKTVAGKRFRLPALCILGGHIRHSTMGQGWEIEFSFAFTFCEFVLSAVASSF